MGISLNPVEILKFVRDWDGKKKDQLTEYLAAGVQDARELSQVWHTSYLELLRRAKSASIVQEVSRLTPSLPPNFDRRAEFYEQVPAPMLNIGFMWKLKARYRAAAGTLGERASQDLRDKYVRILGEIITARENHFQLHAAADRSVQAAALGVDERGLQSVYSSMTTLKTSLEKLDEHVADLEYFLEEYRLKA